jgi:hypothetical protein
LSSRRRRGNPGSDLPSFPLGRSELIAAAFVVIGIAAIAAAVVFTQGGDDEAGPPTDVPLPSASGMRLEPRDADSEAIIALARRSIEVLPQGQWPSLYMDFTSEFRARCPQASFNQAGVDTGVNLGEDLALLAFKFVQDATFTGDRADATIVAEVTGKYEYQVIASFAREDGAWKIAPVAGTEGCSAFNVLS